MEQKNYEEALKYFEEGINLNPSNENNFVGKAKCLENLDRKEDLLNMINDLKGINKIELLIKNDKIDEAENEIDNLLQNDENNLDAMFLKGYILCNKDELDNAKNIFDKNIEKDKTNYLAFYNCGLILLNNNRYNEAEEYFNKCLEIEPQFNKAIISLGNVYVKQNKFDESNSLLI